MIIERPLNISYMIEIVIIKHSVKLKVLIGL